MKKHIFTALMITSIFLFQLSCTVENLNKQSPIVSNSQTSSVEGILSFRSPKELQKYIESITTKSISERQKIEKEKSFTSLQTYFENVLNSYQIGLIKQESIEANPLLSLKDKQLTMNFFSPELKYAVNEEGFIIVGSVLYQFGNEQIKNLPLVGQYKLAEKLDLLKTGQSPEIQKQKIKKINLFGPSKNARIGVGGQSNLYTEQNFGGGSPSNPLAYGCNDLLLLGSVTLTTFNWSYFYCDDIAYDPNCSCDVCTSPEYYHNGTSISLFIHVDSEYRDRCYNSAVYLDQWCCGVQASTSAVASGTVYRDNVAIPYSFNMTLPQPHSDFPLYTDYNAPAFTTLEAEGTVTISTAHSAYFSNISQSTTGSF